MILFSRIVFDGWNKRNVEFFDAACRSRVKWRTLFGLTTTDTNTNTMVSCRYTYIIVSILALLIATSCVADMIDKPTGISFAGQLRDLGLFGVGVRNKGPIKVYSVGMYCSEAVRETLSTVSRTAGKGKEALRALCKVAEENPTSFVL